MQKRFVSIWFPHLLTDWFMIRRPILQGKPFALTVLSHGKKLISKTNIHAELLGVYHGMAAADAKAIAPSLLLSDDITGQDIRLLKAIGEWCIRYTPIAAVDPYGDDKNGLLLDVSGCAHLWGGEQPYLEHILQQLRKRGYEVNGAMADTMGCAWAVARFGKGNTVIASCKQADALLSLSPAALRLESAVFQRLHKLGLTFIKNFISMPRSSLRRRFGQGLLDRIDQALGLKEEPLHPLQPIAPYEERLPCLEPIVTRTGIDIALQRLMEMLCVRLQKESKGLRAAVFKGYRIDGKTEQVNIGTNHASSNTDHLLKLFAINLSMIEPGLGIELFTLEASRVEEVAPVQEMLWSDNKGLDDLSIIELLDRIAGKLGNHIIHRYLPDEHYWPERSIKPAVSLKDAPGIPWQADRPRPVRLLRKPETIEVTAPVPDYPPMNFRYKGQLHTIKKADGPERIEREWWIEEGQHRDYYYVEDEQGQRYWLFRSGHYNDHFQWFIHGFFA
jgi:protein ImuB